MSVIIEYPDGSREEMGLERYRNRVFNADVTLRRARVRFSDRQHLDGALWHWAASELSADRAVRPAVQA